MGIVLILFNQSIAAQNLDELLLAGLPVVVIETVNGEEPTYEEANPPNGCWGQSIKNARKVPGRVQIYDSGGLCFDSGEYVEKESGMTIKVRGNCCYEYKDGATPAVCKVILVFTFAYLIVNEHDTA